MSEKKELTVVLASGGTGGHIFPAEALASELKSREHRVILVTDKRREQYNFTEKNGVDVYVVNSASPGGGVKSKIAAIPAILLGIMQAVKLLKRLNPDVVVGFGGYPSFPTMIAAYWLKIPSVIHEQNSVLGRVNRILAPISKKIATSFDKVSFIKKSDQKKIVFTGNPVRPHVKVVRDVSYPELKDGESMHILVTGGSQGASIFSEVIPQAIASLPDAIKKRIRIDQQCRQEDIENVREIYSKENISADLATFFNDMPSRLACAHLLICRSGASTIAEVTATGRPAIFIPYMHATDDHQTKNATALVDKGAGFIIPQKILRADVVAEYIKDFFAKPDVLIQTALNSFEVGIVDADKRLADVVEGVV